MGNLLGVDEIREAYSFAKALSNTLRYKETKKKGFYNAQSSYKLQDSQIRQLV